jgi:hypothetical protein
MFFSLVVYAGTPKQAAKFAATGKRLKVCFPGFVNLF